MISAVSKTNNTTHPEVFCKKDVLKIFSNLHENTCVRYFLSIWEIFKNTFFLYNTLGGCFLTKKQKCSLKFRTFERVNRHLPCFRKSRFLAYLSETGLFSVHFTWNHVIQQTMVPRKMDNEESSFTQVCWEPSLSKTRRPPLTFSQKMF